MSAINTSFTNQIKCYFEAFETYFILYNYARVTCIRMIYGLWDVYTSISTTGLYLAITTLYQTYLQYKYYKTEHLHIVIEQVSVWSVWG